MRIVDLLSQDKIALGAVAADKEAAIDLLVGLQDKSGCLTDKEAYKKAILAREAQSSTAIEAGIAVPHAKSDCVKAPSLAACTLKEGVDYGAMDGQPSDLFFMIAAPMDGDLHLEILSHPPTPKLSWRSSTGMRPPSTARLRHRPRPRLRPRPPPKSLRPAPGSWRSPPVPA